MKKKKMMMKVMVKLFLLYCTDRGTSPTVSHRSVGNHARLTRNSEKSNRAHYCIPGFSFTRDVCE